MKELTMEEFKRMWQEIPKEEKEQAWGEFIRNLHMGLFKQWLKSTNHIIKQESKNGNKMQKN